MNPNDDPRIALLTKIEGPAGTVPKIIGLPSGGANSALNVMTRGLAAAGTAFRRTAAEVQQFVNMPSERASKLAEIAVPLLAKLKAGAATYGEESTRIQRNAATATAVPAYDGGTTPYFQVQHDLALVAKLDSLPAHQRAAQVQQAILAPADSKRWVEALLRTPIELSGITAEEHEKLRLSAFKAFDPAGAAVVESENEQARQAADALRIVAGLVRQEAPSAWTEFGALNPELLRLA